MIGSDEVELGRLRVATNFLSGKFGDICEYAAAEKLTELQQQCEDIWQKFQRLRAMPGESRRIVILDPEGD